MGPAKKKKLGSDSDIGGLSVVSFGGRVWFGGEMPEIFCGGAIFSIKFLKLTHNRTTLH